MLPQEMSARRMQDLHTVQPNMLDYGTSMLTRDVHNHAPELGKSPAMRPATAITNKNPIKLDAIIK